MSFDLTFAKPKRIIPKERINDAYLALARGEPGDLFENLPVDDVLSALCEAYEDFEPTVRFPTIEDGHGSAEVFHGPYHFSFSFRGDTLELQQRIAGIFRRFGCPVYDPQSSILYSLDKPFGDPGPDDLGGRKPALTKVQLEKLAELRAGDEEKERQRRQVDRTWWDPVEKLAAQITRDCAGARWERLGIGAETCAAVLHNMQLKVQDSTRKPPNDSLAILADLNLVFLGFLGAIPPGHECAHPGTQARLGVARAVEFCHGAWRDGYKEFFYSTPMSRAQTRVKLGWIKPYREGLLLALYIDEEAAIRRLIEWPGTDLPIDDGLSNLTAADNHAQIALAFLLRGEPKKKITPVVEKIRASKHRRATVFWAAVEAIAGGQAGDFAAQMKTLCDLYRKSAFDAKGFPIVHVDGSILWHFARRSNMPLPELAEQSLDLILR